MPAAGFEVRNDASRLLVDGNYLNLGLRLSGEATKGGLIKTQVVAYPYSGNPVVALRVISASSQEAYVFVKECARDGSGWQITLESWAPTGGSIKFAWYVFDNYVPSGWFGLEVYNATEALVFTAISPPMRVSSVISGKIYVANDQTRVNIADAQVGSSVYALLQATKAYHRTKELIPSRPPRTVATLNASAVCLESGRQNIKYFGIAGSTNAGSPEPEQEWAGTWLVIDVTGFQ
ncbi:hypothetical protein R2Y65_006595 [Pseudomonas aeruginosa]|nr:hypothetical protein [Pseudomonas aeruginosa]ELS4469333.1 hypothetical protein [Pseudomonas aeruginosa]EMA2592427.1 hypothetical protein [Pseudomonas aeruginosa]